MENKFLNEQIQRLQDDYCTILKVALEKINTDDFIMILDEINLFWYSNRDIVRIIMEYIAIDEDCYVFTGASYLDIKDYEHFPFATFGKKHIVDDPLHKYIAVPNDSQSEVFKRNLEEQIINTIKDNIQIIDQSLETIIILPVTIISDINSEFIREATNQVFLSMFKDESMTLKRYLNECKTIQDVENALSLAVIDTIVFSEEDRTTDSLGKRFNNFLSKDNPFFGQLSESSIFYFIISGYIAQVLNILLACGQYNMIPYLRYEVTFRYTILLGNNFVKDKSMERILVKTACVHLFYKVFDKSKIKKVDFKNYLNCIDKLKFEENVFGIINQKEFEINEFLYRDIIEVIKRELNKVYDCISEIENETIVSAADTL